MSRKKYPWSHLTVDQMPANIKGVYAFWCRDNAKCIYVGQSKRGNHSIKDRLNAHWRNSHNQTLKLWIQAFGSHLDICYMSVETGKIDALERRLIKAWKPEANIQHNTP